MTWYWWSHWFWITFSHVLINNVAPTGSIDTISPFKPYQHNNNKREPLKFPIAVDSDTDDVIFGGDNENIFKSDLIESDRTWISNSDKIIDNNNLHNNNNDEDVHVVVDYNSKNNHTNSNSKSNNNNNSLNSNLDKTEKINNINSTIKNVSNIAKIYNSSTSTTDTLPTASLTENGSGDAPYTETNTLSPPENETNYDNDNIGFQENDTRAEYEPSRRKSKNLQEFRDDAKYDNSSDYNKNLLARSAEVIAQSHNEINSDSLSSEALSIHDEQTILNIGAISGICAIVIGFFFAFSITGVVLYRRRYINKPQTLSEPDSSGYIDDSTIRDNSDEMYSLDNDSFLNSLEAMTIQNYWTENVKHTKL